MGNRAVIAVKSDPTVGIYLHWNGGPESVLAFLEAAQALGIRAPDYDPDYFRARLGQIIGNFLGGTTSIGYGLTEKMDNSDNGIYYVGEDFRVVERSDPDGQKTVDELSAKEREQYRGVLEETIAKNLAYFTSL